MGMIGRWIDWRCKTHPDVMRKVLNRKFGDLNHFIEPDGKCGCLIGSWGLERGAEWVKQLYFPEPPSCRENGVGLRVCDLVNFGRLDATYRRKRPDAFVIRLLKQRIRKSLGIAPVRVPLTVDSAESVTV